MKQFRNKIFNDNALNVLKNMPDESIDLIATDPPYGISFMDKDWDKALPSIDILKECIRVLKPGAFAFFMSIPRALLQAKMVLLLDEAGFEVDFSPIYWTYATGFPKAMNISKAVNKRKGITPKQIKKFAKFIKKKRKSLNLTMKEVDEYVTGGTTNYSWFEGRPQGVRLPKSDEYERIKEILNLDETFDHFIGEAEREKIDEGKAKFLEKNKTFEIDNEDYGSYEITKPATDKAKELDGSYTMNLKPAVEIVLVAMKPLEHDTFIDQALDNQKGVVWLDNCRIPTNENLEATQHQSDFPGDHEGEWNTSEKNTNYKTEHNNKGRFPANLLVQDDILNDGKVRKSGVLKPTHTLDKHRGNNIHTKYKRQPAKYHTTYGDEGSYSRYFDLDIWFRERLYNNLPKDIKDSLHHLPIEAQQTFPFMITPKSSTSERNKGLDGELKKPPVFSFRSTLERARENWSNPIDETPYGGANRGGNQQNNHPTVKPIELFSWLITLGSRSRDVVLDPFMGSGTTCISAILNKRDFIGVELNDEYFEIAEQRINHFYRKRKIKDKLNRLF